MAFKELHITDPNVGDAVVNALRHDAVMLQMPTVFVLLAPPRPMASPG